MIQSEQWISIFNGVIANDVIAASIAPPLRINICALIGAFNGGIRNTCGKVIATIFMSTNVAIVVMVVVVTL